ncbi:MAG: ribbon-helix-helix domain-containing protein [Pseudolabrys sp.]
MESSVIKRSVVIGGHKTTISLENQFWSALKEIAQAQGATLAQTHRQPRCTDNLVNEFRSHRNRSRSPMPSGCSDMSQSWHRRHGLRHRVSFSAFPGGLPVRRRGLGPAASKNNGKRERFPKHSCNQPCASI